MLPHAISSLPLGLDWVPFFFSAAALIKKKVAQPILLNLNAKGRRQGLKNVKSNGIFFPNQLQSPGSGAGNTVAISSSGLGGSNYSCWDQERECCSPHLRELVTASSLLKIQL